MSAAPPWNPSPDRSDTLPSASIPPFYRGFVIAAPDGSIIHVQIGPFKRALPPPWVELDGDSRSMWYELSADQSMFRLVRGKLVGIP